MKTKSLKTKSAPGLRVQSSNHHQNSAPASQPSTPLKRTRRLLSDPTQAELFAVVWRTAARPPFRLRAGDVIRLDGRLGRVLRVNECAAVIVINRPVREFTTRFDRHVRFQPQPALCRISPNSELPILNR